MKPAGFCNSPQWLNSALPIVLSHRLISRWFFPLLIYSPHTWMDSPFSFLELRHALRTVKKNIAPGLDQYN